MYEMCMCNYWAEKFVAYCFIRFYNGNEYLNPFTLCLNSKV